MSKFFVVSDIHGYYDEMINALNDAGYDNHNPNHWLIVCGDIFDRGTQPVEVMRYLYWNERTILIRGNHEDLLVDMCKRGYPMMHDYANGTFDTAIALGTRAGVDQSIADKFDAAHNRVINLLDKMVNYFETQNYIFVHGDMIRDPLYSYIYPANWRTIELADGWWEQARWSSPLKNKRDWLEHRADGVDGKTLVFGHWHCSKGWNLIDGTPEFGEGENFNIFRYKKLIGIDACTAYTHKVNVLVLEDDFIKEEC